MIDQPTLNGLPLGQPEPKPLEVNDDVLRRMNHDEWLDDFAKVLNIQRPGGPPQTPMRLGAITRLHLAAQYIRLLKKELWKAQHESIEDIPEGR